MIFDLLDLDLLPDLEDMGELPPQIDLQADPDAEAGGLGGLEGLVDRLDALPEAGDELPGVDLLGLEGVDLDAVRAAVLAAPLLNPFARGGG